MKQIAKEAAQKKKTSTRIIMLAVLVLMIISGILALNYPKKMKRMFIQSSISAMEKQLSEAAVYTSQNIEMNFEEIDLLSSLLSSRLDGTTNYSDEVFDIMSETQRCAGFENLGILCMDSHYLFATMSDTRKVQLDVWVLDLEEEEHAVVDLQTSAFSSSTSGEDAVVYRKLFTSDTGVKYMLIAEKPQDSMSAILQIDDENQGMIMMVRANGNVVYGKGSIGSEDAVRYNIIAYLQKLGADENELKEVASKIAEDTSGSFEFEIHGEMYYFVFHTIESGDWICINGYSETVMSGEQLSVVNNETSRLMLVVLLLMLALLMAVISAVSSSIRKKSENKTLEREQLFEEMSRYISSAIVIIKGNEGNVSFISHNFDEIVEYAPEDFSMAGLEKWSGRSMDAEQREKYNTEKKIYIVVNKEDRHYSLAVYNIGIINGSRYHVMIFEDVTDELKARHLLEDSMVRADQASKSKTNFLSKMSHEIRTPLNSVIGFSSLALDRWDTTSKEELHDYMTKIQLSGDYLLELVSDILDISRIEEGRLEISKKPCRLDTVVGEIVDAVQGQMERKNLQFVVEKDYEDVVLNMDDIHTKQVLNNLISNSYKYTEEGGCVGFEIHAKHIDAKRMSVQYIVQDTGIGMTEEFLTKIFEPFTQEARGSRMKKQLRGTGLGMSICKNLVDLQDGTIKVESELGEGSCFTVQMTYEIVDEAESEEKKEEAVDYSCLKGRKILIVDDIEMNRIIVEKFLEAYGLTFDDAEDGQQAVEAFEKSEPGEYLAIFMDVQMPVMNGYEATQTIRKLKRKDAETIMIVGMTADAFSDDVNKAMMSGMNYHVTKPLKIERVLSVLMEICGKEGVTE